jgi:hypothetical protein
MKVITLIKKVTTQVMTLIVKEKSYQKKVWTGMKWRSKLKKKIEKMPQESSPRMLLFLKKDTIKADADERMRIFDE